MRFLDLPNEVLEKITECLDLDSLLALAFTNSRLMKVSTHQLQTLKVKKVMPSLLKYLGLSKPLIRHLDLSNCRSSCEYLTSVIRRCPHITELNVVNSNFHRLSALLDLDQLEYVSITASYELMLDLKQSFTFPTIKKVYIETLPRRQEMKFAMRFLNSCISVEVIHVNLFGAAIGSAFDTLPALDAKRWRTVHTIICSRHFTGAFYRFRILMTHIFFHRPDLDIAGWMDQKRDYYIYEHGNLSGKAPRSAVLDGNVKLLKEFHSVDLHVDGSIADIFQSPWGSPRAVRVHRIDCLPYVPRHCMSTTLVELNLRGCHSKFRERFRLDLIAAIPTLEVLACTLCFFLPESRPQEDALIHKEYFGKALQKLRLRNIFIEGFLFVKEYSTGEFPCPICKTPLTSLNLVDMSRLEYLEELTMKGVDLEASAYNSISNKRLRTVVLRLNAKNNYSGFREFLRRCSNLKHLKLEAFDFQLHTQQAWEALIEGKRLTQMCLRTGVGASCNPVFSEEFCETMIQILKRLKILHLHSPDPRFVAALREFLVESNHRDLWEKIYSDTSLFSKRNITSAHLQQTAVERSLCYSDGSVGVVPPVGWDLE